MPKTRAMARRPEEKEIFRYTQSSARADRIAHWAAVHKFQLPWPKCKRSFTYFQFQGEERLALNQDRWHTVNMFLP